MKSQQPRLIKKKKTHSKLINTFYNMGATRKQDQSSYLFKAQLKRVSWIGHKLLCWHKFCLFATVLCQVYTISQLDSYNSLPAGSSASHLHLLKVILYIGASENQLKCKLDHLILLLKTLSWLPIALWIYSKVFTIA